MDYVSIFIIFSEEITRDENKAITDELRHRGFSHKSLLLISKYFPIGEDVLGWLYRSRADAFLYQQNIHWLNGKTEDDHIDPNEIKAFLIEDRISKRRAEQLHLAKFLLDLNPKDRLILLGYLANRYSEVHVSYKFQLEPSQDDISNFREALELYKNQTSKGELR